VKSFFNGKEVNPLAFESLAETLKRKENKMAGSTYKIVELVGTSDQSWEDAAKSAVETAGESLKDLRIAEITKLDMTIENGKVSSFRARLSVSFKYIK
jgi:flavin-binding protein dodecin